MFHRIAAGILHQTLKSTLKDVPLKAFRLTNITAPTSDVEIQTEMRRIWPHVCFSILSPFLKTIYCGLKFCWDFSSEYESTWLLKWD